MKFRLLFTLLTLCSVPYLAADTPPADVKVFPLWENGVPNSKVDPSYVETEDKAQIGTEGASLHKVTEPRIEVYLPEKQRDSMAAVVICPGGGYMDLVYNKEGRDFARWFQQRGVAAAVLMYRLPSDKIMIDKSIGPLQDVQQAIRLVRRHSPEWHIASTKIGVMGFSAGGHLAACASTMYNEKVYEVKDGTSARPDFSILAYGVLSFQDSIAHPGSREGLLGREYTPSKRDHFSTELHVTSATPPTFLVHAFDDGLVDPQNSVRYFTALQKHHIPSELHIYEFGGHGFGMRKDGPNWLPDLENWLRHRHLITKE
jgi:acetyl esterase/lipase